jgi:putative peptidoglycan lipid II flippase
MARGNRVKRAVELVNSKLTVKWAAILLSGSTLLSSLLGFYRDRMLNRLYYQNYPLGLDAYTAAFVVPDFMYFLLVSGALSVSFIPVFNQRIANDNKKSAWELSSSLINFMALITLAASILIMIFADPLVRYVVAPGYSESAQALAVSMMRVIAVNPFLFAIATVIASMQQAVGRFTFYAMAPAVYNIGIIIGAQFFTGGINIFGWQVFDGGIMGVALGVVLGSIMQLVISAIGLVGLGFDYQFKINWKNSGFRKVLQLLPARSLDQGLDYVNGLVEIRLSSYMASGTVRAFQQASVLSYLPVNLIGVSISNAYFPSLSNSVAVNDMSGLRHDLRRILRMIIWLVLPVGVVMFFGRGYLANFLFEGGDPLIAGILGALIVAVLFRTVYHMGARVFYAHQDTKTPLYISCFSIVINIILAIIFTQQLKMGVYGLALAQSIMAVVEVSIIYAIIARKIKGLFDQRFFHAVGRMLMATTLTGVIAYIVVRLFQLQSTDNGFWATFPKFVIIAAVSFSFYVWMSKLFKLDEADPVIARASKIIFGRAGVKR